MTAEWPSLPIANHTVRIEALSSTTDVPNNATQVATHTAQWDLWNFCVGQVMTSDRFSC